MMADKVDSRSDPRSITDHQQVEKTRTLIFALNLISLNLPLPSDVLRTVSSIYFSGDNEDEDDGDGGGATQGVGFKVSCTGFSKVGDLLTVFKDALLKQRLNHVSSMGLEVAKKIRLQSNTHHRVTELEELSSIRGEDLQMKCLLELYGLKLAELQTKVRADVSSEYCLLEKCANPDKELFNWGLMRLHHPFFLYGMGDAFVTEVNDHQHKKCDKERLPRIEEEKKKRLEIRKRKFFAEMLDIAHEHQFLVQSALKHRKQRNVDIQAWHARQRHHATRIEKSRFQALKSDDLESYLKMVEESKNERLATLLSKTNDLLARLGAAVKRQKDTVHSASFDAIRGLESEDLSELSLSKSVGPSDMLPKEDIHIDDRGSNSLFRTPDLLEGQRQYNSVVHSEREQVTEQPSMLQGGELRPYQLEGLQWMLSLFNNHLNGILADEMGLGKTIQTIAFLAYLMEKKNVVGPHLIVAPKAVLSNWVTEFSTWAPSILAILYDGLIEERKAMRNEFSAAGKFNVMITHYDLIIRDNAFLRKFHWQYVIVDEGHRLKSSACTLARTLVSGYNIRRRLLLTGTPIQNTLKELWALLKFILPSVFNSVQNFEEWFNAPFANRADGSLTNEEELLIIRRLHQVIRPFILRRKKDEVEKNLPGKTQVVLKSDMSAWQKVYYRQVTQEGRVGMVSKNGKPSSLQNLTMQLRKCCNHPYLFVRDHNMWSRQEIVRASGKFELLDRLLPKLQRAGHRVLLFSQMTRLMDILEIYMQIQEFKYLRLDGSTKTEKRATLLQQFNKPDSPFFIFLLSTRAGGLGLNLQTADTVIIFDSDWNPQMDQQAEDRAHRIGQRKEVRVFVLVSVGSVEEVILECTQQKKEIDAKVIQAGLFNTTSTAKERKEMLQEIMKRGTSSLSSDIPSEREMNRLAARSEEEFNLFEKMEEERRQRENYKSRLMEEHEVPDWVYLPQEKKVNIGKRRQREEMEVRSDDMLGNSNRSEDWSNNILPWKIHKKKRSLLVPR